jgi:single-stranded-DNA-specific exonuclease
MEGYLRRTGGDLTQLEAYLDLLAVSIAADIVPITGENRILMHYGLKRIMEAPRPGIRRLFAVAQHTARQKTVSDIVFTVAPRINAAGRMSSARAAVDILRSGEADKTADLLQRIEAWNQDRRKHDRQVFEEAVQAVEADAFYKTAWSTVVWGEDWHKGVVGIVASRLIEYRYRPTLVLTRQGDAYTGSARSIEGLDIHEVLTACAPLLTRFGGHAMAAGATLPAENLLAFREAFDREVRARIAEEDLVPVIRISLDLHLPELDNASWNVLKQMGPFGPGNMQPVFRSGPLLDAGGSRAIGSDKTHLRVQVCNMDGTGPLMEGVGFGLAAKAERLLAGEPFWLVYTLEENEWQGKRRLQMMVKDIAYEAEPSLPG